jgi:hypothetical protein
VCGFQESLKLITEVAEDVWSLRKLTAAIGHFSAIMAQALTEALCTPFRSNVILENTPRTEKILLRLAVFQSF